LIFEGIAKDFVAIDSIWFKETAQGIEITWQADISFKGLLAHLLPIMKPALLKLGKTSMQGLAQALANNNPPPLMQHQIRSQLILPELWQFTKYGYLQAQKNGYLFLIICSTNTLSLQVQASGLGLASAMALAQKGANLTLVVRNQTKGEEVKHMICQKTGNTKINLEIADMSLMSDVLALSQRLTSTTTPYRCIN
jgi:dehydrogenase/reductase SDR family protein 12